MKITILLCMTLISIGATGKWWLKQQISEWTFQNVRRRINMSITMQSVYTVSRLGCAAFCSNVEDTVVQTFYFIHDTGQCMCTNAEDNRSETGNDQQVTYAVLKTKQQVERTDGSNMRTTVWPYKRDCSELYEHLYHEDGVYMILPPGGYLTDTWCDMVNGGWTVVQRRMDGSEEFYRGWNDYVIGFGNRTGEYWLGLENMHRLTTNGSELYIYMEAFSTVTPSMMWAHYSNFKIGDITSEYTVEIDGFNGTCGDAFGYHNGQSFSTFDNDNDRNCAARFKGGWWYNKCHEAQLTGVYYKEGEYSFTQLYATGLHWYHCWYHRHSSKLTLMKIRRHLLH